MDMLLFIYMESQQNEIESVIAPLKKVTPLSKYLAMVLFIVMPFLGGWIGYTLALEQVIEIENATSEQEITEEIEMTSKDAMVPKPTAATESSNVSVSFQKVAAWITYSATEEQRVVGLSTLYDKNYGTNCARRSDNLHS